MADKKIKVAVLMGGPSAEHEVSLDSGKAVMENLDKDKYQAWPVVIDRRGYWLFPGENSQPLPEPEALLTLCRQKVDVVFIAMHGEYGEDGTLQKLLSDADLKFTGSRSLTSALAMNKTLASRVLSDFGLQVPESTTIHYLDWNRKPAALARAAFNEIGTPLVVKPSSRGSSVGVSLINEMEDLELKPLRMAIDYGLSFGREVIVQKCVRGREFTCGVLEQNGEPTALVPTEIIPMAANFFDYQSKYTESGAQEVTPPENLPRKTLNDIKNTALRAHEVLRCSGLSRTDMILGHDSKLYVLEVNTIPGLTNLSLLPQGARAAGIKFSKLLDLIIESAA